MSLCDGCSQYNNLEGCLESDCEHKADNWVISILMERKRHAEIKTENEELLSCPFCGGTAILLSEKKKGSMFGLSDYAVVCRDCKISTRKAIDEYEALKIWNKRINK